MSIPIRKKAPGEVIDFGHTYATTFNDLDTIISSEWSVTGDMVIDSDTFSADNSTTTVWVSGGTIDTGYDLKNTIVTAMGATITRTIRIVCVQR